MATKRGGLELIGDAVDNPAPAGKPGKVTSSANEPNDSKPLLPPGCPVIPLGKLEQTCFYLDELRQLISLDPTKHAKQHIRNLFGRRSDLCDAYWPRLDQKGNPKGHGQWHPEIAADVLQQSCAIAGIFDPQGRVFGRGAHRGKDGELILHCGDAVFVAAEGAAEYCQPGLIEGMVYPTAPKIPRPHKDEQDTAAGEELLALFKAWYWARPIEDPILLLGWVGCALIGGALPWRPHVWITGSSATGKSTLQHALNEFFDGGALPTADATEAALRQLLKQQTLPVLFDELEANEDNRRAKAVIGLARLASSGADAHRGGQDHEGHAFKAKTCFLFSSILLPPLMQQDRNRMAILELEKIPRDANAVELDAAKLRELGQRIRRRLVDQWHRLEALLAKYRTALAMVGHGGRSQDQFGTLLAVADLLLYDTADDETIEDMAALLRADTLAEKATEIADEEECVNFLASTFLKGRGGDELEPVSVHILKALAPDSSADKARDRLESYGLRVVQAKKDEHGNVVGHESPSSSTSSAALYLAIANAHNQLAAIFEGSRWNQGGWTQAFKRVDGAVTRQNVRFSKARPIKATMIPLPAILDMKPVEPQP
jgi:hypothetical protein